MNAEIVTITFGNRLSDFEAFVFFGWAESIFIMIATLKLFASSILLQLTPVIVVILTRLEVRL